MSSKTLTDYYPVYKELNSKPKLFNAEELLAVCADLGFNKFQKAFLLVKNSFEGYVFMNFKILPEKLFSDGTLQMSLKPELLILSFYQQYYLAEPDFAHFEKLIHSKNDDPDEPDFESLFHFILVNHLIRFPVEMVSSAPDSKLIAVIHRYKSISAKQWKHVMLNENFLGEFVLVDKVNHLYNNKFKVILEELRLKEDVLNHYLRKLHFAPMANTEEELDKMIYQQLIEERNRNPLRNDAVNQPVIIGVHREEELLSDSLKQKNRTLYRTISKNCAEIHIENDADNLYPELKEFFMEANVIYNFAKEGLANDVINEMYLSYILAKAMIYRKTKGMKMINGTQLLSEFGERKIITAKDDFKQLQESLENQLLKYQSESVTGYKMPFVIDDNLDELHRHFLMEQTKYVATQINKIREDIRRIIGMKSKTH